MKGKMEGKVFCFFFLKLQLYLPVTMSAASLGVIESFPADQCPVLLGEVLCKVLQFIFPAKIQRKAKCLQTGLDSIGFFECNFLNLAVRREDCFPGNLTCI